VWLAIQLAALGLAAAGVEFSVRWPRPAQQLALHQMLAVQIVASSLLFPWLMPSWRLSLVVIATSWPMAILAAALSEHSNGGLLAGTVFTTCWLATLAIASQLLRSHYLQCISVLVAALATLGGVGLWYVAREFGSGIALNASGPLAGALLQIDHPFSSPVSWAMVIGPLTAAVSAQIISRRRTASN